MANLAMRLLRSMRPRPPQFDASRMYAISGFSPTDFYQTAVGGGEAGVASGFGELLVVRPRALTAAYQYLVSRASSGGWQVVMATASALDLLGYMWITSGSFANPTFKFPTARLGRVGLIWLINRGDAQARLSLDRLDTNAQAALSAYTPGDASARERIGLSAGGGDAATGIDYLAHMSWRGIPSDQQLIALADYVRDHGDLPALFPLSSASDADLAALAPRAWYRADTYTLTGGDLATLPNRISGSGQIGGQLGVGADVIAAPSADAAINGQLSFALTGTQYLIASNPASAFRFLHDGTGFEAFFIYTPTDVSTSQIPFATTRPGNINSASGMVVQLGTSISTYRVGNGSAAIILTADSPFNLVNGVATYANLNFQWQGYSFSDQAIMKRSGSATGTPSTSDPQSTLVVGAGALTFDGPIRGRVADLIIFNRRLTDAERQTVRDYIATRYGIGAVATTHRWSVRDTLALANVPVIDGQAAPAQLPDTVTASATDRMDKQGTGLVVRYVPESVEGRETFGVLGANVASYLVAASGFQGHGSGFSIVYFGRPDRLPSAVQVLFGKTSAQWDLRITASNQLQFFASIAGVGGVGSPLYQLLASDLSQPMQIVGSYDQAAGLVRLYVRRLEVGSGTAPGGGSGYAVVAGDVYFGKRADGFAQDSVAFMGALYCQPALTLAEVQALADESAATGRIGTTAKALNRIDLTQDVIDNGGPDAGVPAVWQDRIGSDDLTTVGGMAVAGSSPAGLTGFSAAQFLLSSSAAALLNTAQWFVAIDVLLGDYGADGLAHYVLSKTNITTHGLEMRVVNGSLSVRFGNGTSVATAVSLALTTPEQTTRLRIILQYNATGTATDLYVGSASRTAGSTSVTYAAATTSPFTLGTYSATGANAHSLMSVYGVQFGNALLSNAERDALLADTTFAAIAGKTITRQWFPDDIAAFGGAVPPFAKDRVGTTDLVAGGSGTLQVSERTEHVFSFETEANPIMHRTQDMANPALNQHLSTAGGTAGDNGGLWWALMFSVTDQSVPDARVACGKRDSLTFSNGWDTAVSVNNLQFTPRVRTSGGIIAAPLVTIAASEVGKIFLLGGAVDFPSGLVRTYCRRAQVGAGTALGGSYLPASAACTIGPPIFGGVALSTLRGVKIYGLMCGRGLPTLAHWQAAHDAAIAREDIVAIPGGYTEHLWSITQSVRANGGVMPAAVNDQIGTDHMTVSGSLGAEGMCARAWGW